MPKDLIPFSIGVCFAIVGAWGSWFPGSFTDVFHDTEDDDDFLRNASPKVLVGVRIACLILFLCGLGLTVAGYVGISNPPDFDPLPF